MTPYQQWAAFVKDEDDPNVDVLHFNSRAEYLEWRNKKGEQDG